MATLDAFLIRGKKKTPSSLQDTHIQHAFVNPFTTAQVKKPSVPCGNKAPIEKPAKQQQQQHTNRNTIAHYFTPTTRIAAVTTTDADVEMEEAAADVCVIRNKIPVMHLWDMIQYELDQDPFYNNEVIEEATTTTTATLAIAYPCMKRRRSRQYDAEQHTKRHRKTDHELSSIMTRFLNMGSTTIKHQPTTLNSLDWINEFTEDMEDLSRHVRSKQTSQESQLYLYHITQELFDFAIN